MGGRFSPAALRAIHAYYGERDGGASHEEAIRTAKTTKAATERMMSDALTAKLKAIGGKLLGGRFTMDDEPDLDILSRNGREMSAAGAKRVRGDEHECHRNSARTYSRNPGQYKIATGYVLGERGQDNPKADMWRAHSWLVDKTGKIVETTFVRSHYFGVVLNKAQADDFVRRERNKYREDMAEVRWPAVKAPF